MDDAGIDVAVTSISTPGVHMGDDAKARDLARRVNELSADLIKERPDRLGGFAALPLPDVDGALRELEYAMDVLRMDGVVLFSNARGIYLGDARFRPLFDELERRKAVVLVHPTASFDAASRGLDLPDTSRSATLGCFSAVADIVGRDGDVRSGDLRRSPGADVLTVTAAGFGASRSFAGSSDPKPAFEAPVESV